MACGLMDGFGFKLIWEFCGNKSGGEFMVGRVEGVWFTSFCCDRGFSSKCSFDMVVNLFLIFVFQKFFTSLSVLPGSCKG